MPIVRFDRQELVWNAFTNEELVIEPSVENIEDEDPNSIQYGWFKENGVLMCIGKNLHFTWKECGDYLVRFKIKYSKGEVVKEIKVIVTERDLPILRFDLPPHGFISVEQGDKLTLEPSVIDNTDELEWFIDGESASKNRCLTIDTSKGGDQQIKVVAKNNDGECCVEFRVSIKIPNDSQFSWDFEARYQGAAGRRIIIRPFNIMNAGDATYTWYEDKNILQSGKSANFAFIAEEPGKHSLKVNVDNASFNATWVVDVIVYEHEGKYRRPINKNSAKEASKVCSWLPGAGWSTKNNLWPEVGTEEEACRWAEERLTSNEVVSLGGFGGYIIAEFDHSVINKTGSDFGILSDTEPGLSEPGVVFVMQDENNNGLPDDTWFEIAGSEYKKPTTRFHHIKNYSKVNKTADISPEFQWLYPSWIGDDTYKLRGTKMDMRVFQNNQGEFMFKEFLWGYADNLSQKDGHLISPKGEYPVKYINSFDIDNAVYDDGEPVKLQYIDWIKVQTGVDTFADSLGTATTDIRAIIDVNLHSK